MTTPYSAILIYLPYRGGRSSRPILYGTLSEQSIQSRSGRPVFLSTLWDCKRRIVLTGAGIQMRRPPTASRSGWLHSDRSTRCSTTTRYRALRRRQHAAASLPGTKNAFKTPLHIYKRAFYQDRLGTNIGKTQKRLTVFRRELWRTHSASNNLTHGRGLGGSLSWFVAHERTTLVSIFPTKRNRRFVKTGSGQTRGRL